MKWTAIPRSKAPEILRRPVEPPLRAELFTGEQLARHAAMIAAAHRLTSSRGSDRLLERLDRNEEVLRAYHLETRALHAAAQVTPAGVWLLDNFYLIEEQIQMARRHLPRGYSRELPHLAQGPSKGLPRVYDIVLELISHHDAQIDAGALASFIAAYQLTDSLTLGELWAVPIMIRLALIENLKRIAIRLAVARGNRALADYWVERMQLISETEPSHVVIVVAEMAKADLPLSHSFVAQFCQRVARKNPALQLAQDWLEHRLFTQGQSIEQYVHQESQMQAANQVTVSNCIASLRFLGATDWGDFVEGLSHVERTLNGDPPDVYRRMDFATRDQYRHAVEELSRYGELSEVEVARKAIKLAEGVSGARGSSDRAAHVGYYLVDQGKPELEAMVRPRWPLRIWLENTIRGSPLTFYLGGMGLLVLALAIAFVVVARGQGVGGVLLWILSVPFVLAAAQTAVAVMNWTSTLLVGPRLLPRMDFEKSIPTEFETIIVIPTVLSSLAAVDHLLETLEIHYLANRDERLRFALLSDLSDSAHEERPEDDILIERASAGIRLLQRRYSSVRKSIFYLFHRPRRWNPSEGVWMGYERKRGKLGEFNALLRGGSPDAFSVILGDVESLSLVRFVITLDTDTQLPRDAARQLIGTLAHPLNRPEIDPVRRVVTRGYGILQPRVGVSLPTSRRSLFVRLFAGAAGIDPYTRAVSDTYQDLFSEGTFIGKGIYDVDAFEGALHGRFPENTILSHDLIESCHARSGLVSDVEFFEEFPSRYNVDVDRRHRWIRGDWQILPWLLPWVPGGKTRRVPTPLTSLSRWKIADNLRRSMTPAAILAFLMLAWSLAPQLGSTALAIVLTLLLSPELISTAGELARRSREVPRALHWRLVLGTFGRKLAQQLLTLAFLPYDAFMNTDAIVRSLLRTYVTRKRLLQWRTSGEAERATRNDLDTFWSLMWSSPLLAASMFLFLAVDQPSALAMAAPLLGLWLVAPLIAWYISQPIAPEPDPLSEGQLDFLHGTARRTWWFFEYFVTARENWLPPDNFQEEPVRVLASRTSPTNIGLSLLANLAAYDLGYISAGRLVQRTKDAFATMERMDRHQGHFYNWYDTRTLQPLPPLYISTVDSGNLAGMLMTLAAGLRELADAPILSPNTFPGLGDTVAVLARAAGNPPELASMRASLSTPPATLRAGWEKLHEVKALATRFAEAGADDAREEVVLWAKNLSAQSADHIEELRQFAPWLDSPPMATDATPDEPGVPTLRGISAAGSPGTQVGERVEAIQRLACLCDGFAHMEWRFLFDESRKLFSIGYNLGERRRDAGLYDLLASEARLASYVAVAQGDVGQDHWFSLGRLLVSSRGEAVMISWSGSMFEYLMPQLIMPNYQNTLIDRTCVAAVRQQMDYGKMRGVPWGVSESGYNRTDVHLNYQYRAFGVPGIGLKRGLVEDLVIAPYATALALMVYPGKACENLQRLADEGRAGGFGFYESVDYTPSRMPPNQTSVTIRSYMAHHQGMILLSLLHLLGDKPMQRRFSSCPALKAADLLLQERVPRVEASVFSPELDFRDSSKATLEDESGVRVFTNPSLPSPEVHLLSNGRYHVAISSAGGGFSRWNDLAVTRWREDPTRDCWGLFIYLRDADSGKFWSAAHQPTLRASKDYEAIFAQGRAEFRQRHIGLSIHMEITVSPEDDVELRRVTITNRSHGERRIELTSYAEVVMAAADADSAHPAFSNLFVQTEFDPALSTVYCTRRPRSKDEHPPCMLHLIGDGPGEKDEVSCETDRSRFVGRGGSLSQPAAIRERGGLSGTTGSVLDPIVALRRTIRLAPGEKTTVVFVLGVAERREAAEELARKYQNPRMADRAFDLAWTHSQVALRQLNASEGEAQLYGRLAGALIYANPLFRANAGTLRRNRRGQSSLWGYGISGDNPIVLLCLGGIESIELVEQLVKAHSYWRMKGLTVELVIVNDDVSAYRQTLQDTIVNTIILGIGAQMLDRPGGIFVRRHEQIADENLILLQSVARIVLSDHNGTLAEQWQHRSTPDVPMALRAPAPSALSETPRPLPPRELIFHNGLGGFTRDGHEYVITLQPHQMTPAPWVNVLANPCFGTVISESGGAYTWLENAHEFRLTPWNNDPVRDTTGEAFYMRDDQTGQFWSPTPLPARGPTPYVIRHGFGYTVFEHTGHGIASELWIYVAMDAPVKFAVLKLNNESGRQRQLSPTAYYEWVLGDLRAKNPLHVQTELDPKTGAFLARNPYSTEFPGRIAFVDLDGDGVSTTGDRGEFIGRNGSLARPEGLRRESLSGKVGAGLDPCGALMIPISLRDGEEHETEIRLGVGRDPADLQDLIQRFRRAGAGRTALEGVWSYWNQALGTVIVETPDGRRQRDGERLASLPDTQQPHVGEDRLLPIRRSLRIPRSTPGLNGTRPCRARARA
jgi:cyclic beta-1,2-glucan synthetase